MGRQYKKGDILKFMGDPWTKDGEIIILRGHRNKVWYTTDPNNGNDGIYSEEYFNEKYHYVGNVLETDKPQANMTNEELTNTARYSTNSGKQLFDVLADDLLTDDQYEGFLIGNIYKYIKRHKEKGGITDLEKARVYLDTLIKFEEEK